MADAAGVESRRTAIEVLERVERDGAYANLLLRETLDNCSLSDRDRGFVAELVYGVTRRQRTLDFLIDQHLHDLSIEPRVRAALRIGAYQLVMLDTAAHAAVDATVGASPKRVRGLVNAVLRKVAKAGTQTMWPSIGIELSYPEWMIKQLTDDLGDRCVPVLRAMNEAATVHIREDGYRQDLASQEVGNLIGFALDGAQPARGLDVCAAPGGKATAMAGHVDTVIGLDLHLHRAGLVEQAAATTGADVLAGVADGRSLPFPDDTFGAVLVDAPCSGLGSLRRRPDARWRIERGDIDGLAGLQFGLIEEAKRGLSPGGILIYSVCTMTRSETLAVDARVAEEIPELTPLQLPAPWESYGRGGRLLPDTFVGDAMTAFAYRLAD